MSFKGFLMDTKLPRSFSQKRETVATVKWSSLAVMTLLKRPIMIYRNEDEIMRENDMMSLFSHR